MKKIGIITFHRAHNYGAMLQAYALSKTLNNRYDVQIIDYINKKIYANYKVFKPFRKNIFKYFKNLYNDIRFHKLNVKRFNSFESFINNKCYFTKSFYSLNDILRLTNEYDIFITGSDQVWNPKIVGELSDVYTLNFNSRTAKKISYAASIGDVNLINKYKNDFINKISQLDCISVREMDAKDELSKIIKNDINVVLDPTLLLKKEEWNKELVDLTGIIDKYIVAYVVKPDEEYIKIVNDLSEKTGLKVLHFGLKNPGYKNVWKSAYTEGPLEFVNYIKNAEYVVATSFHATVFSIIFNKKFFIVPHRQTGSRVTNLLEQLGIDNRVYYSLDEFKNIDYKFDTDWEKVEKKLEEERERSINWLINAIEGKEDKNV